jgi:hypothetical protein
MKKEVHPRARNSVTNSCHFAPIPTTSDDSDDDDDDDDNHDHANTVDYHDDYDPSIDYSDEFRSEDGDDDEAEVVWVKRQDFVDHHQSDSSELRSLVNSKNDDEDYHHSSKDDNHDDTEDNGGEGFQLNGYNSSGFNRSCSSHNATSPSGCGYDSQHFDYTLPRNHCGNPSVNNTAPVLMSHSYEQRSKQKKKAFPRSKSEIAEAKLTSLGQNGNNHSSPPLPRSQSDGYNDNSLSVMRGRDNNHTNTPAMMRSRSNTADTNHAFSMRGLFSKPSHNPHRSRSNSHTSTNKTNTKSPTVQAQAKRLRANHERVQSPSHPQRNKHRNHPQSLSLPNIQQLLEESVNDLLFKPRRESRFSSMLALSSNIGKSMKTTINSIFESSTKLDPHPSLADLQAARTMIAEWQQVR